LSVDILLCFIADFSFLASQNFIPALTKMFRFLQGTFLMGALTLLTLLGDGNPQTGCRIRRRRSYGYLETVPSPFLALLFKTSCGSMSAVNFSMRSVVKPRLQTI